MVVDDEKDLLALVKGYLKRAGYEVAVTTSCEEGLNILNGLQSDLIYMDVNVGTDDGRVMCKQIKSVAEHRHIPIILISANDEALQPSQLLKLTTFYLSQSYTEIVKKEEAR